MDLAGADRWLDAPICGPWPVGASWLAAEAERVGGAVREDVADGGLLPTMSVLDGAGFRAADLDEVVRHFYEHTACWRMEVWAHLVDDGGEQLAAGWLRTLAATGEFVYSGCYSARLLPGSDQPSVHVAFPLESGNVQVFLRPSARPDGSLVLSSPDGTFGDDGAYVVVRGAAAELTPPASRSMSGSTSTAIIAGFSAPTTN